jgi:hypothetical protein
MNEEARQKAHELVDAFFNGKEIVVKDPDHGIPFWVSLKDSRYWSYLEQFCKKVKQYCKTTKNTFFDVFCLYISKLPLSVETTLKTFSHSPF